MLASAAFAAAEPPADLAKRVAERETLSALERDNYTYRQTVVFEEMSDRGNKVGEYREVRDIIFTPQGDRTEQVAQKPVVTLKRLKLTDEDFADIRDVQPLLFTNDKLWAYETKVRGDEEMDGVDCWVMQVRPRQILHGQRLFDGLFWVDKRDYSIVRSEGRAVPQFRSTTPGKENLFPHFTTVREKIGEYRFPIHTYADDLLDFSSGPLRVRLTVRYRDYKRFAAESKIVPESPL